MIWKIRQWGISHWLGSGLGSEVSEPSRSWACPEPPVWTRFSSDFQCRIGISDPSSRVFTLVAQLGLSSESEPSLELSQCEMPHCEIVIRSLKYYKGTHNYTRKKLLFEIYLLIILLKNNQTNKNMLYFKTCLKINKKWKEN